MSRPSSKSEPQHRLTEFGGEHFLITQAVDPSDIGITGGLEAGLVAVRVPPELIPARKKGGGRRPGETLVSEAELNLFRDYGFHGYVYELDFSQAVGLAFQLQTEDHVMSDEELAGDVFWKGYGWRRGLAGCPFLEEDPGRGVYFDLLSRVAEITEKVKGDFLLVGEDEKQNVTVADAQEFFYAWPDLKPAASLHLAVMLRDYKNVRATRDEIDTLLGGCFDYKALAPEKALYMRQAERLARVHSVLNARGGDLNAVKTSLAC